MEHNLLKDNQFYYHPFTRKPCRPPVLDILPDGETKEEGPSNFQIVFKGSLTLDDIAKYFYQSMSLPTRLQDLKRDSGAVRYLIGKHGLDKTLFAIDLLVDDYYDSESRTDHYPSLLECGNFMQAAYDRMGRAKQIAMQYKIDEANFYKEKVI